jgi:hypothetical protein
MNIFTKIVKVLFNPAEAIPHLSGADWVLPLLLVIAVSFTTTLIMFPTVLQPAMEQQMQKQMEKMPAGQNAQMEAAKKQMTGPTVQIVQSLIGAVLQGVGYLLISLFIMVAVALGGGKTIKFPRIFPIVSWAGLVGLVETLLRFPIAMMKESPHVSFGFAALVDTEALGGPLYTLLNNFNPFALWWIAIVSAGISYYTEFSRRKSVVILLVLGIVWSLVSMVFSMLGASFGG